MCIYIYIYIGWKQNFYKNNKFDIQRTVHRDVFL